MNKKMLGTMTALSVAQPWAQCIIQYGKNVENRTKNLRKRGTIAIYASTSKDLKRFEDCKTQYGLSLRWDDLPKGAIIGFVDIVDVVTDVTITAKTKKWFVEGGYGYVLENPIMLGKPILAVPPRGAVIFWYLEGKTLDACLQQIPQSRVAKFKPWEDATTVDDPAFMQLVQPNEKLALIVGSQPLPRTELTKKLWQYIEENGLQDKKEKAMINTDSALQAVCDGKKQVSLDEVIDFVCQNLE